MDETGTLKLMQETNLREWRIRHGYSQEALMAELGVRSRQTISTWENADRNELPRMLELSLIALEKVPECRMVAGQRTKAAQSKKMKQASGFRRRNGQ